MPEEDLVVLKFRLYDGSDIGPFQYAPTATVATLKERIFTDWPKDKKLVPKTANAFGLRKLQAAAFLFLDKKLVPKTANDIKLINAGKILENNKTVGQCRVPFGDLPKVTITMHVVVQPPLTKAKTEKKVDEAPKKSACACTIL